MINPTGLERGPTVLPELARSAGMRRAIAELLRGSLARHGRRLFVPGLLLLALVTSWGGGWAWLSQSLGQ